MLPLYSEITPEMDEIRTIYEDTYGSFVIQICGDRLWFHVKTFKKFTHSLIKYGASLVKQLEDELRQKGYTEYWTAVSVRKHAEGHTEYDHTKDDDDAHVPGEDFTKVRFAEYFGFKNTGWRTGINDSVIILEKVL